MISLSKMNFDYGIKRLASVFGVKSFDQERLSLIWNATRDLSDEAFSKIVDHFLANSRYAPLPNDFLEAARAEKKRTRTYEHQESTYDQATLDEWRRFDESEEGQNIRALKEQLGSWGKAYEFYSNGRSISVDFGIPNRGVNL